MWWAVQRNIDAPRGAAHPKLCCTVAFCPEIQELICFPSVSVCSFGEEPRQQWPQYQLTKALYCLWKLISLLCFHHDSLWQQKISDYRSALWNICAAGSIGSCLWPDVINHSFNQVSWSSLLSLLHIQEQKSTSRDANWSSAGSAGLWQPDVLDPSGEATVAARQSSQQWTSRHPEVRLALVRAQRLQDSLSMLSQCQHRRRLN